MAPNTRTNDSEWRVAGMPVRKRRTVVRDLRAYFGIPNPLDETNVTYHSQPVGEKKQAPSEPVRV